MSLNLDLLLEFSETPSKKIQVLLPPGITGIFGPSGTGKSSLLRAIAGWPQKRKGSIVLEERVLEASCDGIFIPADKRAVALVSQPAYLFPHLTVSEQIQLVLGSQQTSSSPPIHELLADFELTALAQKTPHQLSGGEKQRLALARAFASSPQLLLLDEAFSALDHGGRARILQKTQAYLNTHHISSLVVSHDARIIEALCSHCLLFSESEFVKFGPTSQILESQQGSVFNTFSGLVDLGAQEKIARVRCDGCDLYSTASSLKNCNNAQIAVSSSAIIVSKEAPSAISARNIIQVQYQSKISLNDSRVRLKAQTAGGAEFRVDMTEEAFDELRPQSESNLWLLFKANQVEHIA